MSYSFYDDIVIRIKNLVKDLDTNNVIIKEYYRRLKRDTQNMISGDVKDIYMKKIQEMEFGLIDPMKTTENFISKYEKQLSDLAEQTIKEDIKKIVLKKNELGLKLSKKINDLIKRVDSFILKEINETKKNNIIKMMYSVIDNKMKKVVSFKQMTPIMKWIMNKIQKVQR